MAPVQIELPIEIKIFVPAQAAKFLRLLAQMALHLGQRFGRIDDWIAAVPLHGLDLLKDLDQFLRPIRHEARIAEAEITRGQRRKRIAESTALEAQFG